MTEFEHKILEQFIVLNIHLAEISNSLDNIQFSVETIDNAE